MMSAFRACVFAFAALIVSTAGTALAQRVRKPNPAPAPAEGARRQAEAPTIAGQVVAFEADKSITVERRNRNGVKKSEFRIVKDETKIELLGDVKAIAVGTRVSIWANKDMPDVAARIAAGAANAPQARNRRPNNRPA